MTNEQVIKRINEIREILADYRELTSYDHEALDIAISALSKQSASSEQAENLKEALTESDRIYEASAWWENYIKVRKKTKEELISKHEALDKLKMLCDGCYLMEHCGQCNPNCLLRKAMDVVEKIKTDSERVSPSEQEKSNSFPEKLSEETVHEMNCSNVPDFHVGKTDFQPGDKFILELGQERRMFGEFEIAGTDLYVETRLLEKLTRYEPGKFEIHNNHTDCIWYHYLDDDDDVPNTCPSTCSQYRDGWNDAMDYIFCNGKGYQPYKRKA